MHAFTYNTSDPWETTKGLKKTIVADPVLDEKNRPDEKDWVIVKLKTAGVCGSDRGIWFRTAFRDNIFESLKREQKSQRIVGHEFFGEIVEIGSAVEKNFSYKKGDLVSAESHITCGKCYQCVRGEKHVCTDEIILGIGIDGVFAEYIKVPAKILWKTDVNKIRPEIACMQEPFGNAVHATTRVDVRDKTLTVMGCGPIGLMSMLIAKALGVKKLIAVDPNDSKLEIARSFGADHTFKTRRDPADGYDAELVKKIREVTDGVGTDIVMEMAGFHASVNSALQIVRRGGDVILFGIKNGDIVLRQFDRMIVRGITLHSIIGRQIFQTWETTQRLLEDQSNGIQTHLWNDLMNQGKGTLLPFHEATTETFEQHLLAHPKIVLTY
ncbi:MAG: alcohol dehydrogenase catalytic domain-containing protein [Patescibacteria group bacterium]|jgi:threonine 3-dehydrogenase